MALTHCLYRFESDMEHQSSSILNIFLRLESHHTYLLYVPYNLSTPEGRAKKLANQRKWYSQNKERVIAWVIPNNERYRKKVHEWYREYKSQLKCQLCPESHPACLHFHHNDPTQKDISIAKAVQSRWSIDRIKTEISKCQVLCANCHAKIHWAKKKMVFVGDSDHEPKKEWVLETFVWTIISQHRFPTPLSVSTPSCVWTSAWTQARLPLKLAMPISAHS